MRRPSGTCEQPSATIASGRSRVTSTPSSRMRPALGRTSPLIARSSVDLPAPFEPISVTISPARTSNETPRSAWIAP